MQKFFCFCIYCLIPIARNNAIKFTDLFGQKISRAFMTLFLAISISFLFIGCSCSNSTTTPPIQQLNLNIPSDPATLDPRKGGDMISSLFHFLLFDGLVRFDDYNNLSPALAEKNYRLRRQNHLHFSSARRKLDGRNSHNSLGF